MKLRKLVWWILTAAVVIAICCLGMLIFSVFTPDTEGSPTSEDVAQATDEPAVPAETSASTAEPPPTDTPIPTDTPAPLAPPYREIKDTVESMTEVQWKRYLDELEGQRVEDWQGWVEDVDQKLLGQYELWIDMEEPGDPFSAQDIYIPISEELALSLNKDQLVKFSGSIERVNEFLGSVNIHLENATVTVVQP